VPFLPIPQNLSLLCESLAISQELTFSLPGPASKPPFCSLNGQVPFLSRGSHSGETAIYQGLPVLFSHCDGILNFFLFLHLTSVGFFPARIERVRKVRPDSLESLTIGSACARPRLVDLSVSDFPPHLEKLLFLCFIDGN